MTTTTTTTTAAAEVTTPEMARYARYVEDVLRYIIAQGDVPDHWGRHGDVVFDVDVLIRLKVDLDMPVAFLDVGTRAAVCKAALMEHVAPAHVPPRGYVATKDVAFYQAQETLYEDIVGVHAKVNDEWHMFFVVVRGWKTYFDSLEDWVRVKTPATLEDVVGTEKHARIVVSAEAALAAVRRWVGTPTRYPEAKDREALANYRTIGMAHEHCMMPQFPVYLGEMFYDLHMDMRVSVSDVFAPLADDLYVFRETLLYYTINFDETHCERQKSWIRQWFRLVVAGDAYYETKHTRDRAELYRAVRNAGLALCWYLFVFQTKAKKKWEELGKTGLRDERRKRALVIWLRNETDTSECEEYLRGAVAHLLAQCEKSKTSSATMMTSARSFVTIGMKAGTCAWCGRRATKVCGRCRGAKYCGRRCQRLGWKTHCPLCTPPPEPST